ncbi:hypothetical protein SAMN05444166_7045 [Singulisphaera sp. GP187]|uniref:hypothetical protein n=1 Tax=Singulisphaera sp. GP187 TaxID=1882752 RepID=UPI000927BA59|nr:hypothetical protein [Singulisphaera sp. GP187]SIO62432.1 hypothetical protein SAMN05444166_7045 [Singulisphaera sp. GP187]
MGDCHTGKRLALVVGLVVVFALVPVLLTAGRGKALATEKPGAETVVAEARVLVTELETQLRTTAMNLKKAKQRLARLERSAEPSPKEELNPVADAGADQTDLVEGVWRIVGVNGHEGGNYQKPPYDEYKIMSAGHYLWLSFSPETGKVLRSGGGEYSIRDGKYKAQIEYSNSEDLLVLAGQEYKGTFKLEGKKWYHFGKVPNGAVFDELWERVH